MVAHGAVGQASRAGQRAGPDDPSNAGNAYEHVTLNEKQYPAFTDVRVRRALDPCGRSRAHREDDPRWARAGDARADSIGVVGVHRRRARSIRSIRRRRKTLLDEAGWRDSNGDGIRERDGRPLAFTLITQAGFAVRESVAQVLQRQFRDIGVEHVDLAARRHEHQPDLVRGPLRRDAALVADARGSRADVVLRQRSHAAGGPEHQFRERRCRSRELVYAADRTVDLAERKRLLREAQHRIAELAIEIPLYNVTKLDAVPSTLQGFTGQSDQRRRLLECRRVGTVK